MNLHNLLKKDLQEEVGKFIDSASGDEYPIKEDSVTDLILSRIKSIESLNLVVKRPSEKKTASDMLWRFVSISEMKVFSLYIQSKILFKSKKGWMDHKYKGINHKAKSYPEYQLDQIIRVESENCSSLALYFMYNHGSVCIEALNNGHKNLSPISYIKATDLKKIVWSGDVKPRHNKLVEVCDKLKNASDILYFDEIERINEFKIPGYQRPTMLLNSFNPNVVAMAIGSRGKVVDLDKRLIEILISHFEGRISEPHENEIIILSDMNHGSMGKSIMIDRLKEFLRSIKR